MPILKATDSLDIKYRPKILEDLIGQDEVVCTLKGMFESGSISCRTIMLYGPTGSGKTSTARIIARYLNCTGDSLLCGKCPTCMSSIENHFDCHELNMANATGVDNVRELINQAQYLPQTNFRVFILDEFHQCFPEYVHVMIDYDKSISIREIYENPDITHVLSYNLETKEIERKRIIRKLKQNFKGRLNKVYLTSGGYLPSTPNHSIYTETHSKIESSKLQVGTRLVQYDGSFFRYRVCKHCNNLIEVSNKGRGEHDSLFHSPVVRIHNKKTRSRRCKIGINPLILEASSVRKDPENTRARIEAFINNSTNAEVKELKNSKECDIDVFNLEIEDNHNYFAVAGDYRHNHKMKLFNKTEPTPLLVGNCSVSAKECFLKSLEEPPEHVVWILCTTEPEKFKDTVRGRCLRLQMKAVQPIDLAKLLYKVAKAENSPLAEDKKSIMEISKLVRGQPRDGLKALEKVMLYVKGKGKVNLSLLSQIVKEVVDLPPSILVSRYLLSVYSGKFATAFTILRTIQNADYFLKELIDFHRNVLHVSVKPELASSYQGHVLLITEMQKLKLRLSSVVLAEVLVEMVSTHSQVKSYTIDAAVLLDAMTCQLIQIITRS